MFVVYVTPMGNPLNYNIKCEILYALCNLPICKCPYNMCEVLLKQRGTPGSLYKVIDVGV